MAYIAPQLHGLTAMQLISDVFDVCRYCDATGLVIVHSCDENFETTADQTAVVLQQMGKYYYIDCVTPMSTSVARLLCSRVQPVTMRAAPRLISERLDYLEGLRRTSTTESKVMLYRALGSTAELEMLSELEGHPHKPLLEVLPWGLTTNAQVRIREIYAKQ